MKQRFLAYVDYGMGGVFFWVLASCPEDIEKIHFRLQVLSVPPSWMKPEDLADLEKAPTYDIDGDAEAIRGIARLKSK